MNLSRLGANIADFGIGFRNAVISNHTLGLGRELPLSRTEDYGMLAGDAASIVMGVGEVVGGTGLFALGSATTVTTLGIATPVSVPLAGLGLGIAVEGAVTTGVAAVNLFGNHGRVYYKVGENIGLGRFTQRLKRGTYRDPKTRETIVPDRARNSGEGGHGGSWWKLLNKKGKRIGTISQEGIYLRE